MQADLPDLCHCVITTVSTMGFVIIVLVLYEHCSESQNDVKCKFIYILSEMHLLTKAKNHNN